MFTGTVKLAQIDDYISPGQSCIQPKIMKQGSQPEKATVTLNDCLACSGCLTSAESLLVEQMSTSALQELLRKQPHKPLVVMVAPQVLVALALQHRCLPLAAFRRLEIFFKGRLRAKIVLDLWEGIELAHQLGFEQYLQRHDKNPILCSECPGWVCYAQKTLSTGIVDLLSRVKSPQQVLGRIVKQQLPGSLVVSVMPCYDKKLEAIRFDLSEGVKQVDITITTTELQELFFQLESASLGEAIKEIAVENQMEGKVDRLIYKEEPFRFVPDQVSNGHVDSLLMRLKASDVKVSQLKNSDFIEIEALVEGKSVRMAKCYGFRNIQRVVQQIKKKKCSYTYVEMMACPGGCYSGGGQPKFPELKPKELSEECTRIAQTLQRERRHSGENKNKEVFKADYHVVERTLTQAVMNW